MLILCSLSFSGAHDIIKAIEKRRSLKKLILANNELGDDGCKVLFHFLGSEKGRQHKISVICVNSSCIGDKGLEAISEYLAGNSHLKELILQNVRSSSLWFCVIDAVVDPFNLRL